MNSVTSFFLITLIATTTTLAIATRAEGSSRKSTAKGKPTNQDNQRGGGHDELFGSGDEFGIPGFENGWEDGGGYGFGYGGPEGGHHSHGVYRPSVVCKDKGRCYHKKLTCPAKCFKSVSWSGKGGGGGGGGGGCTMDCKKRCVAYC